jgi:predicted nucleic acid-binding protein
MSCYWDTSCVLKLYCREADSPRCLEHAARAKSPLVSSVLLSAELIFAFQQKEWRGELAPGTGASLYERYLSDLSLGRFLLLPVGNDLRDEARSIAEACFGKAPVIPLRTLDGLHLASALLSGSRGILTTDERMKQAAQRIGLALAW